VHNFNFLVIDIFSELFGSQPLEEHAPFDVIVKKQEQEAGRGRDITGERGWRGGKSTGESQGAGKKWWERREKIGERNLE
jgi:hypothetical protein